MRIIAGKYKNRVIPIARNATYRPSTRYIKEAIFSILTTNNYLHINSRVLDLFAGTGGLGFEALSRGANFTSFVDINYSYLRTAERFAYEIGACVQSNFLRMNALSMPMLRAGTQKYDIAFIDPPYYRNMAGEALHSLLASRWLENNAVIIIELASSENMKHNLLEITNRDYGDSKLLILQNVKGAVS